MKALKYFETAGELGFCALCDAAATSCVRIGLQRLPVSFCDVHRWQAGRFGRVVAVDVWPGQRPHWLPKTAGGVKRRPVRQRVHSKMRRRYKEIITKQVAAEFARLRRQGLSLARIGRDNGVVETSGGTIAHYLEKYGYDRATGRRVEGD